MFDFLKRKKVIPAEDVKKAGTFEVQRIEQSNSIVESLGISKERGEFIAEHTHKSYHSSKNMVTAASKASSICVHQNELFYASMILTDIHLKNMQMNHMMKMMVGGGPERPQ